MPHDTKECCKIWRKTDLWFGKWHEANFHQNIWKCQNWYFHGILLSKVENAWATTYRGVISNDTEDDEKAEEKLTCRFKIDIKNLTNFDSRTWKSQKFTL